LNGIGDHRKGTTGRDTDLKVYFNTVALNELDVIPNIFTQNQNEFGFFVLSELVTLRKIIPQVGLKLVRKRKSPQNNCHQLHHDQESSSASSRGKKATQQFQDAKQLTNL
jgi:hypothetical protein